MQAPPRWLMLLSLVFAGVLVAAPATALTKPHSAKDVSELNSRLRPAVITDLGTLGGPTSAAYAINNAGEVTGTADTSFPPPPGGPAGFDSHAFRFRRGSMTDLTPDRSLLSSVGRAINAAGDVAGALEVGSGDSFATVWRANGSTWAVPTPGALETFAYGINKTGDVVGGGTFPGAWLTNHDGSTTSLFGEMVGGGTAFAINDRGQVVGKSNNSHAFLYQSGAMRDLGTLGGTSSEARAINENGTVVGSSMIAGDTAQHAFRYRDGRLTDLGTLGGTGTEALAVNDCEQIVGTSAGHAFIYRRGAMVDLNTLMPRRSHWTLTTANGINDAHEIVGTGAHNGVQRAFLMTLSARGPAC
jgi:probable HAF family extracellular repeat protein